MAIDWLALSAAFLGGLFGGVHCVAMCGALAAGLAAGARPKDRGDALRLALLTNAGRVGGYVIAGVLVGTVGAALLAVLRSDALVLGMRMAVGGVMLLAALHLLTRGNRWHALTRPAQLLWRHLAPLHRRLLPANTAPKRLAIGVLWGWMPCGLSLTFLFAAWFAADALHSGLLMAAFGLGTLPLMLPLSYSGARIARALAKPQLRSLGAVVIGLAGVLTIAGPWLVQVPALQVALTALGCRSVAI